MLKEFLCEYATVRIYEEARTMGAAAAGDAAATIRNALAQRRRARIIVGTGPSQALFIEALTRAPAVDWSAVEVFHMDEYVGMPDSHPASFRRWLREHVVDLVRPGRVHYLSGDALSIDEECRRYAGLLDEAPVDVVFVGFGENGHIAFNDPGNADFRDPLLVKRVTLDTRCRAQQVGEGHFPNIESAPAEALTITCPAIMACRRLICCVPDRRKAEAVRGAIKGPVSGACPASLVRTHSNVAIYLDSASASLL